MKPPVHENLGYLYDDMFHALMSVAGGALQYGDEPISEEELKFLIESTGEFAAKHWGAANYEAHKTSPTIVRVEQRKDGWYQREFYDDGRPVLNPEGQGSRWPRLINKFLSAITGKEVRLPQTVNQWTKFTPEKGTVPRNRVKLNPTLKAALEAEEKEGYFAQEVSPEFGGDGLSAPAAMVIKELFNFHSMAGALKGTLNIGVANNLIRLYDIIDMPEAMKRAMIEKLVAREFSGTMVLTEPGIGSDLPNIEARAERQDDGTYHIKGAIKIFITFGEHDMNKNIIHLTLARTDKGVTLYVVPRDHMDERGNLTGKRNGVEAKSLHHKFGIHGSPTCEVAFGEDDNMPAVAYRVGEEGEGLKLMFGLMNEARQGIAVQGPAIAARMNHMATKYAVEREQGTDMISGEANSPIINHLNILGKLAINDSRIMAARMTLYHTTVLRHKAHHEGDEKAARYEALFTNMVKSSLTDMGVDVSKDVMNIYGGFGYMEDSGVPQGKADSAIGPIYEGANDIQALGFLRRQVCRDGGETMLSWINETREAIEKSSSQYQGDKIFTRTQQTLDCLEKATQFVLKTASEQGPKGIGQLKSVMSDYLTLFEKAAGGFMMIKSMEREETHKQNHPDPSKYRLQAHMYAVHHMYDRNALLDKIIDGVEPVLQAYEKRDLMLQERNLG